MNIFSSYPISTFHWSDLLRGLAMGGLIFAVGCSRSAVGSLTPPLPTPATTAASPFSFTVNEDLNTGEALHLTVAVRAHIPWNPDNIGLKLSALSEGEEVASKLTTVGKAANAHQVIPAEQELLVPIGVTATGVTDYQVELSWGDEARAVVSNERKSDTPTAAELENLRVTASDGYVITGSIKNRSATVIQSVVLGIGFISGAEGELYHSNADNRTLPDNEEKVEISNLALAPGQSRPLRVKVQRPESSGQQSYSVSVRIIR